MTPSWMTIVMVMVPTLFIVAWVLIRPRYRLPTPADEIHFAPTTDGWDLALYHYLPESPVRGREPVVLCHGMLSNRYNVDLDERVSLARYLRSKGFDVWVMELRGHGRSCRSDPNGTRRVQPFDWTIDDYIQKDLPAVLGYVRKITGAEQVHWFGHSMGGMLLYGHCAVAGKDNAIRSAVLSDAPASFRTLRKPTWPGRVYGKIFPVVPAALVLPFLGPAAWVIPGILGPRYGIRDRRLMLSLLSNAIIPWGSSRVLLQLCSMMDTGRFCSVDGLVNYEKGVEEVHFPLMILSSARKLMGEPPVQFAFDHSPAKQKKYVKFSRSNGYLTDYTHSNLLVHGGAPGEVFPEIADWFVAHSSA